MPDVAEPRPLRGMESDPSRGKTPIGDNRQACALWKVSLIEAL